MIRIKFTLNKNEVDGDNRPIKWPIKYPYWCYGESETTFNMLAYADSAAEMRKLWPESINLEIEEVDKVEFTEEFPCPAWYIEPERHGKVSKDTYLDTDLIDLIKEIRKRMSIDVSNGSVEFSKYGTEKVKILTDCINALPDGNRYKKCSESGIVASLREREGSFYIRFINYLYR